MNRQFEVMLNIEEEDFCSLDLVESIKDGIENIGNHTLIDVVGCIEVELTTHDKLRKILMDYGCEEYGDAIVDEICELFNYPKTEVEE